MDLYYRLCVFIIQLPPLRERKEDLILLANHFLKYYSDKENKTAVKLDDNVIKSMLNYSWPGNIRELENTMARSVLLSTGGVVSELHLPSFQKNTTYQIPGIAAKTIEENEREYILRTINKCKGKLQGQGGAAEMMNINVSTLRSRMKKLGISKTKYS